MLRLGGLLMVSSSSMYYTLFFYASLKFLTYTKTCFVEWRNTGRSCDNYFIAQVHEAMLIKILNPKLNRQFVKIIYVEDFQLTWCPDNNWKLIWLLFCSKLQLDWFGFLVAMTTQFYVCFFLFSVCGEFSAAGWYIGTAGM